jgi:hypothetical protein
MTDRPLNPLSRRGWSESGARSCVPEMASVSRAKLLEFAQTQR